MKRRRWSHDIIAAPQPSGAAPAWCPSICRNVFLFFFKSPDLHGAQRPSPDCIASSVMKMSSSVCVPAAKRFRKPLSVSAPLADIWECTGIGWSDWMSGQKTDSPHFFSLHALCFPEQNQWNSSRLQITVIVSLKPSQNHFSIMKLHLLKTIKLKTRKKTRNVCWGRAAAWTWSVGTTGGKKKGILWKRNLLVSPEGEEFFNRCFWLLHQHFRGFS